MVWILNYYFRFEYKVLLDYIIYIRVVLNLNILYNIIFMVLINKF